MHTFLGAMTVSVRRSRALYVAADVCSPRRPMRTFWSWIHLHPRASPDAALREEILEFDHAHPTRAKARLSVDKDGNILDVKSWDLTRHRWLLWKLPFIVRIEKAGQPDHPGLLKKHPIYSETTSGICGRLPLHSRSTAAWKQFRRYMKLHDF